MDIIGDIIRREGGYVNHPNDRGGPTKFGITQRTLSAWLKRPATIHDVQNLDIDTAREIYEVRYLSGPRIDTLPPEVVPFVTDCCVHHGPRNAIRFVQNVCNEAGFGPVDADGVIGPQSRKAAFTAQEKMQEWFLKALCEERRNFFRRIVARDPSQQVFLNGWMNRVKEFDHA